MRPNQEGRGQETKVVTGQTCSLGMVSAGFATVREAERLAMQWNSKGPIGMGLEEEKDRW